MLNKIFHLNKYPRVKIESVAMHNRPSKVLVTYLVSINGVTRKRQSIVTTDISQTRIQVKGNTLIRLTDFNITPIKAAMGTIRIKNQLKIHFHLVFDREAAPE